MTYIIYEVNLWGDGVEHEVCRAEGWMGALKALLNTVCAEHEEWEDKRNHGWYGDLERLEQRAYGAWTDKHGHVWHTCYTLCNDAYYGLTRFYFRKEGEAPYVPQPKKKKAKPASFSPIPEHMLDRDPNPFLGDMGVDW